MLKLLASLGVVGVSYYALREHSLLLRMTFAFVWLLFSLALSQQYNLWKKKQSLPGPKFVPPFIGMLFQIILTPFQFYKVQEKYGDVSWTSVLSKFVVFTTKTEFSRKVFKESSYMPWLSLGAKKILTDKAIPFTFGAAHKELRRQLLPMFTPRALSAYLPIQERVIRAHISDWLKQSGNQEIRPLCRDLNMATSIAVFVGPTVAQEVREEIARQYFIMNQGFLCFPVSFPGTTLWNAIKAREKLVILLSKVISDSRRRMEAGEEPGAFIDLWMEQLVKATDDESKQLPEDTVIFTVLSFLFASQDAMSSALVYSAALMADHPNVLAKLREEQARVRPNDEPFTLDLMREASYTRQTVQEILRFRPPATMVPHEALEDCPMGNGFTVPRGTVMLPSIWSAHFETGAEDSWEKPELFDPERFNAERNEGTKCGKYFLAFGLGPHHCLGKEYAKNQIELFLTCLSTMVNWERVPVPGGDEIIFGPTIFPKDGCVCRMTPRH